MNSVDQGECHDHGPPVLSHQILQTVSSMVPELPKNMYYVYAAVFHHLPMVVATVSLLVH